MQFRPCIDLHNGVVKQIVGSSLSDKNNIDLKTNFKADKPPEWFASLYKKDKLLGGHVIKLGSGNEKAAKAALSVWPGGMQIGGGINMDNAGKWLDVGAGSVIVTSFVFHNGIIDKGRLKKLSNYIGKNHLVLDLSCRVKDGKYIVVTDRWQTYTKEIITHQLLEQLSKYCHEFLVHGVDVEGKLMGIETPLVKILGDWGKLPVTYAGGISSINDIKTIEKYGKGNLDFTIGSALDIFGGTLLKYKDIVNFNKKNSFTKL